MNFYKYDKEIEPSDIQKFQFPNQKIGVIIHIKNEDGKILLQQRGNLASDENGLYEDVGGKVEKKDLDYKSALLREIKEEMGTLVNIEISGSLGIYHCYKNNINWIFIIFYGKYLSGKIQIMEPDKCMGYKFFDYEEAINSSFVSESCKYLIKAIESLK